MSAEMKVEATVLPPRTARRRFDARRDGGRLALFLLGLLVLNVAVWLWMVRPVRAELAQLEESRITAEGTETRTERALEQLKDVHAHVTSVEQGIRTFYEQMLATKRERLVPFQAALVHVGRDFSVAPEKVSIGENDMGLEGLERLAFSFPLIGGYENLRQFLARLESLDQFLIVREVALQGAREGGRALQLNIVVETYFNAPELREPKKPARPGSRRSGARGR